MFAMFAIGPLPLAGVSMMISSLEILNELKVWLLTKSMGMRATSWVLAGFIFTTIVTLFLGGAMWIAFQFTIIKKSNPTIMALMIWSFTFASYF